MATSVLVELEPWSSGVQPSMKAVYFLQLYEAGYRDFDGVHLRGVDLSSKILVNVDLTHADLTLRSVSVARSMPWT